MTQPAHLSLQPRLNLLAMATAMALAACGGGAGSPSVVTESAQGNSSPGPLSGTVAVGAPMTDGKLRVLDAVGNVVAGNITVGADGTYQVPSLTGTGPWRIEACGYTGPNYQCIYSVAQGSGTANVTPLTTATVLLASGRALEGLMNGPAIGLGGAAVDGAQTQLRQGLASVMNGNVPSNFDFVGGNLTAGSRTGYDKVLDAVGVSTGVDGQPYVQITPRLGQGNLYLQQGSSSGSVSADAGAAELSLSGLEGLFRSMSAAVASPAACADANSGMVNLMAADSRLEMEGSLVQGAAPVGEAICQFFAMGDKWGSKLLSPALGRCDLSSVTPMCAVSFVLQDPSGAVESVGSRMGVAQDSGVWKFLGDLDPIHINIFATAQRDRRVDSPGTPDQFTRAISFGIPALSDLGCARVWQRDAAQNRTPVAILKPFPGQPNLRRLSLWQTHGFSNTRSLDPALGTLRNSDDTWLALPEGSEGDAVVRNFLRGGRSVSVGLFSDNLCSVALQVGGRSEFEVDIQGVPPVLASMPGLPWLDLSAASAQALVNLSLAAQASGAHAPTWTSPRGPLGTNGATLCTDRAMCGDGQSGRLGETKLRPNASGAEFALHNGANAVTANSFKMLSIYGRNGEGMMLQTSFMSCPGTAPGQPCQ